MAYKSKICKAFFFGRKDCRFAPNHPPNLLLYRVANPIAINGLPIAIFDLAEPLPKSPELGPGMATSRRVRRVYQTSVVSKHTKVAARHWHRSFGSDQCQKLVVCMPK